MAFETSFPVTNTVTATIRREPVILPQRFPLISDVNALVNLGSSALCLRSPDRSALCCVSWMPPECHTRMPPYSLTSFLLPRRDQGKSITLDTGSVDPVHEVAIQYQERGNEMVICWTTFVLIPRLSSTVTRKVGSDPRRAEATRALTQALLISFLFVSFRPDHSQTRLCVTQLKTTLYVSRGSPIYYLLLR